MIVKRNWNDDLVVLQTMDGRTVEIGDVIQSVGDKMKFKIMDARAPHKPSSTGRVSVKLEDEAEDRDWTYEYFPSVVDLEWVQFKPKSMIDAVKYEQDVHFYLLSKLKEGK